MQRKNDSADSIQLIQVFRLKKTYVSYEECRNKIKSEVLNRAAQDYVQL